MNYLTTIVGTIDLLFLLYLVCFEWLDLGHWYGRYRLRRRLYRLCKIR